MSDQPPSGRPTGPPSGPLSGPEPAPPSSPPGPPSGPTSGGGGPSRGGAGGAGGPGGPGGPGGAGGTGEQGGDGGPGGPGGGAGGRGEPWYRSFPKIAAVTALVVAAVVISVVLTRPGGGPAGARDELVLQAADATGRDPFTESTAGGTAEEPPAAVPTTAPPTSQTEGNVRDVDGATPGLYGGTRNAASCDIEKQIGFLTADPAKNRAFAGVLRIEPSAVPAHLRSLTAVQLRVDTWVTNHGYKDGAATGYQAVLQAGTAVLVDGRGVPQVRCACGNPLTPPDVSRSTFKRTGDSWEGFEQSNVVIVRPAPQVVADFVVYDPRENTYFSRGRGDTGGHDKPVPPPDHPLTPTHVPTPPGNARPDNSKDEDSPKTGSCPPGEGDAGCPPTPPSSRSEGPKNPSPKDPSAKSEAPKSKAPESKPPKNEPPKSEAPESKPPKTPPAEPRTDETAPNEPPPAEPPPDLPIPPIPGRTASKEQPPPQSLAPESRRAPVHPQTWSAHRLSSASGALSGPNP
ncbi:DUF6777 domain-containing protein [Streptomyces sp. NPDC001970]